jgi:hypothetical protein
MFDERGAETFLVLDLHRIEYTAVAIDADEEFGVLRKRLELGDKVPN